MLTNQLLNWPSLKNEHSHESRVVYASKLTVVAIDQKYCTLQCETQ